MTPASAYPQSPITMDRLFYKLDIGGIVYLVDTASATAYTYDLTDPVEIGKVIWTDPKAAPQLQLREDWSTVLGAKLAAITQTQHPG